MSALSRPAYSLAWRLAVAAVLLRLAYTALVQAYSLMSPSPYMDRIRESYMQPPVLVPLLANAASTLLIVGLAAWGATRHWLARHNTSTVDQPGRLLGTFLALQALYTLCLTSGIAMAQSSFTVSLIKSGSLLETWFGLGVTGRFIVMNLLIRAVAIPLEIIGICLALRIAAWTTAPAGPSGAPALTRRNLVWICGLTILAWQTSVSITLGGYLQMQTLEAGWAQYAMGYWLLPLAVLALSMFVCLKVLPRHLETPRLGRAVALGSLAFWFAQALGIGLGLMVLKSMTWDQLVWATQSQAAAGLALLAYGALLALGCFVGSRLLYREG
ncbi:hypothetical protein [Achromobacter arsenitoxydans]|uniref:Uncharacterized protein n=1 Tax=Achromobacter arsenitoxydans SY8 TaxID=477184 RepID=H0F5Y3_9BURK|nr:hypothetical protein [Achromobacter arsenitoxydans]EHK66261.1 hypothetical protein KYC_10883 [Achromobacter arsenitoxydans SY8]